MPITLSVREIVYCFLLCCYVVCIWTLLPIFFLIWPESIPSEVLDVCCRGCHWLPLACPAPWLGWWNRPWLPGQALPPLAAPGPWRDLPIAKTRSDDSSDRLLRFSNLLVKMSVEPATLCSYLMGLDVVFVFLSTGLSKHFRHICLVFFQNVLYFWVLVFNVVL